MLLRIALLLLMIVHGFIHLIGFAQAFRRTPKSAWGRPSRFQGLAWSLTALVFIVAAVLFLLRSQSWWMIAGVAAVVSQLLIFSAWHEARIGTVANMIILFAVVVSYAKAQFYAEYQKDVAAATARARQTPRRPLTQQDLERLPKPVQRYFAYTGALHGENVVSFRARVAGEMRRENSGWFPFQAEQFSLIDPPLRFFFIHARMKGVPVTGYHRFVNGSASMHLKVLSLFTITDIHGSKLDISERVTMLSDICMMAPAALIDDRIRWEPIDDYSARVIYTVNNISVSAVLFFDEKGRLVNFVSDDRYAVSQNTFRLLRWMMPVSVYKRYNGRTLPAKTEGVYRYPGGDQTFGRFVIRDVRWNQER